MNLLKNIYLALIGLAKITSAYAGDSFFWPEGREAAVVLTYDDALPSHLNTAIPQLNEFGFRATFYITASSPELGSRVNEWRAASNAGHELGNHSLLHPCSKSKENRAWVQPWQDLDLYSKNRYESELKITNTLLTAIDSKQQRTYAYPCADTMIGDQSVLSLVAPLFVASRHYNNDGLFNPEQHSKIENALQLIPSADVSSMSGRELINVVEKALASKSLVTLIFHGIGAEYLSVSTNAHRELLEYLNQNRDIYWVTTMMDAATHIKNESVD